MEKLKEFRNVHLQVVARLVLRVNVVDSFWFSGSLSVGLPSRFKMKKYSFLSVNN